MATFVVKMLSATEFRETPGLVFSYGSVEVGRKKGKREVFVVAPRWVTFTVEAESVYEAKRKAFAERAEEMEAAVEVRIEPSNMRAAA